MSNNIVKYGSKTFEEVRNDLVTYIKQTYPELISDFTDASIGAVLIDINAGVVNNLSINTDKVFTETQLDHATQRANVYEIAKNNNFNLPSKRPSVTVVDLSVDVPVRGDKPDNTYYPVLRIGSEIIGGGKVFQTLYSVDWNSPISGLGDPNRVIRPNTDSEGNIISYTIIKREIVVNGRTNIYKRVISSDDVKPFFSITLPDTDVFEIESVILLEGTNISGMPNESEFHNHNNRYYEVEYLAQQKVFIEKINTSFKNNNTDNLKSGEWVDITKKFIKEFTVNGYCKITFGSGDGDNDTFNDIINMGGISNREFLNNYLNNTALGEKLKNGYTLFVKYKSGGGSSSNIGSGVLTGFGNINLTVVGSNEQNNQNVRRSLSVNNPIPAIGGNDGLTVDQIKYLVKYNNSSQNRDVTLTDYKVQVYKMPGRFGSPFRVNTMKENNKIIISILGIGSDGKLQNSSNTMLKENIAEYLSNYRMINDYIEVRDGKIINIGIDVNVYVENINDNQVSNNIINIVRDKFSIMKSEMNTDIFIGKLQKEILNVSGVVNVIDIKIFNKIGENYSVNSVLQPIKDTETGEIELMNNTVYSHEDSMFEIKYPEKDIRVFLRKKI